jgi:hypothetical protein
MWKIFKKKCKLEQRQMDYSQFDLKAYIANHLQNVENKYPKIEQVYGNDFQSPIAS